MLSLRTGKEKTRKVIGAEVLRLVKGQRRQHFMDFLKPTTKNLPPILLCHTWMGAFIRLPKIDKFK